MHKNIEIMLLAIVGISVLPVAVEFLRDRARRRKEPPVAPAAPTGPTAAVGQASGAQDVTGNHYP
mgnify:CR=1 FL=1